MRVLAVLAVVLAVASSTSACRAHQPRLEPPPPAALTLPAPPDTVLAVGRQVLTRLGWTLTTDSVTQGSIAAVRTEPGDANRRWMVCPEGYTWWGPGLPHSTVAVQLEARLGPEGTNVRISAEVPRAYAYDRYFRETHPIRCVSSGAIEAALADSLRARLR
jgi:hypothetical protein